MGKRGWKATSVKMLWNLGAVSLTAGWVDTFFLCLFVCLSIAAEVRT